MSNNQVALLTILGFFTVIGLNLIAWTFLQRARTSMANRLERSIGLAIPATLRPIVGHRLVRTRRMNLAGTVVGGWAALLFAWPSTGVEGLSTPNVFLMVGLTIAGGSIGAAVSSVTWPARRDLEEIRYARPRAVGLSDYVAPIQRVGAWVAVGLSALIILLSAIITAWEAPTPGSSFTIGWIWITLAVITLCFFEVVGRRMVSRPQPSGSEPELVWEDALRAADLRGLAEMPITIGMFGVFFGGLWSVLTLSVTMENTVGMIFINGGAVLGFVLMLAVFIYAVTLRPERFFLKRLWPQYFYAGAPPAGPSDSETVDSAS